MVQVEDEGWEFECDDAGCSCHEDIELQKKRHFELMVAALVRIKNKQTDDPCYEAFAALKAVGRLQ